MKGFNLNSVALNGRNDIHEVIVRGFEWCVTKHEVKQIFTDVNILNGENGIQIFENAGLEVHFCVASTAELDKALAYNNQKLGFTTITGLF